MTSYSKKGPTANEMGDGEAEKKICCLCGDVGLADALLRCLRCGYRLQHKYCSRYYPDKVDMEMRGCEWCIHAEEEERKKKTIKRQKRDNHDGSGPHMIPDQTDNAVHEGPNKDNNRAVDRWRKLAKATKTGRRYKLLADVLCS